MKFRVLLVLSLASFCASACQTTKSSTPTAPTVAIPASDPAPAAPPHETYPTDGPGVIAYVTAKYPEKLAAGVSYDERIANMQFLRDRVIEVGTCGGLDLGWNLKRGGPDVSNDFIAERLNGEVIGHDIAFDYDDTSHPLQMYWGGGDFPTYKPYPPPACQ